MYPKFLVSNNYSKQILEMLFDLNQCILNIIHLVMSKCHCVLMYNEMIILVLLALTIAWHHTWIQL